jgi:hypothetical protein
MHVNLRRVTPIGAALLLSCGNGDDSAAAPPAATARLDGGADVTLDGASDGTAASESGPVTQPGGALDATGPVLPDALASPVPCNGDFRICDKTYDAVAYASSHAAMAYAFPPFPCPAQRLTIRQQLDQGVRALGLEAHTAAVTVDGGSPLALCLVDCAAGELPIAVGLEDVRAFLDVNPREIVTLLIEGGADAALLAGALAATGLDTFALTRALGDPWPTLDAMIAAGTRVVVFADVTGAPPPWMLPLWTYVAETGTQFSTRQAMTCAVTRGAGDAPLFRLNEFLVDGEGGAGAPSDAEATGPLVAGCDDPALAHAVNAEPFFTNRVTACTQQHGAKPTFVAVDDIDDGDLSGVIRALNGP